MKRPLDTGKWRTFFLRNSQNRPEPAWEIPPAGTWPGQALLEQSIREFQLGDGGGPASLIAWNRERYRQSQAGLAGVIDLWFEEGEGAFPPARGPAAALRPGAGQGALEFQSVLRHPAGGRREL